MFKKEGSSSSSSSSSSIDVPLRKSDRKKLRNTFLSTYTNNNNNNNDDDNVSRLINDIFLGQGDIFVRKLRNIQFSTKEIGDNDDDDNNNVGDVIAIQLYLRSPSEIHTTKPPPTAGGGAAATAKAGGGAAGEGGGGMSGAITTAQWPYTKSIQPILLEVEINDIITPAKKKGGDNNPRQQFRDSLIQKRRRVLLPTLALLSIWPTLIPQSVIIHSATSKYLCRGAHLMRSGIISIHSHNNTDNTDDHNNTTPIPLLTSILVQGNQQPFAFGFLHPPPSSSSSPQSSWFGPGTKGIAVHIISSYGDDLWISSNKITTKSQAKLSLTNNKNNTSSFIQNPFSLAARGHYGEDASSSYDNGHYGNIGFTNGTHVLPFIHSQQKQQQLDAASSTAAAATASMEDGAAAAAAAAAVWGLKSPYETIPDHDHHDHVPTITNQEEITTTETKEPIKTIFPAPHNDDNDNNNDDTYDHDQILLNALYKAILTIHPKHDLPIPSSTFYSKFILPHCNNQQKDYQFNIKHTYHGKFGLFLLEQSKKGLLSIQSNGNDAIIISVNRTHLELKDTKKHIMMLQQEQQESSSDVNNDHKSSLLLSKKSTNKRLTVVNLYLIPQNIIHLLIPSLTKDDIMASQAKSECRRNTGFLTSSECRILLESYISCNDLISKDDPSKILLDGPLTDILFTTNRKNKKKQQQNLKEKFDSYPTELLRKDIHKQWLQRMDIGHALVEMPGNSILSMKRGPPPKIYLDVEARQNRKKFITRIKGLEKYGIDPIMFAQDVSKRFACSSSTTTLDNNIIEISFQGHLIEELKALLIGDDNNESIRHGGVKGSEYRLPKNIFDIVLRKGVPATTTKHRHK